jgi:histidinol-phosphate phosphatase family protein
VVLLKRAGVKTILISNQAGVGRGVMTMKDVDDIHRKMRADLRRAGGGMDGIYVCPHRPEAGCACRKPKPGLLKRAARDFRLDLSRTPFVGDSASDVAAARAAGCPMFRVGGAWNLLAIVRRRLLAGRF